MTHRRYLVFAAPSSLALSHDDVWLLRELQRLVALFRERNILAQGIGLRVMALVMTQRNIRPPRYLRFGT